MKLQNRIEILIKLKEYLIANPEEWQLVKKTASIHNGWFTLEFIDLSINNIIERYLGEKDLVNWVNGYQIMDPTTPKNIGIVMAGNIPMVGFHDFLSVFVSGHYQTIKLSEKDNQLLKHLVQKMYEWNSKMKQYVQFAILLKGCDAYIATGSNNSARYFEQYFSKIMLMDVVLFFVENEFVYGFVFLRLPLPFSGHCSRVFQRDPRKEAASL